MFEEQNNLFSNYLKKNLREKKKRTKFFFFSTFYIFNENGIKTFLRKWTLNLISKLFLFYW